MHLGCQARAAVAWRAPGSRCGRGRRCRSGRRRLAASRRAGARSGRLDPWRRRTPRTAARSCGRPRPDGGGRSSPDAREPMPVGWWPPPSPPCPRPARTGILCRASGSAATRESHRTGPSPAPGPPRAGAPTGWGVGSIAAVSKSSGRPSMVTQRSVLTTEPTSGSHRRCPMTPCAEGAAAVTRHERLTVVVVGKGASITPRRADRQRLGTAVAELAVTQAVDHQQHVALRRPVFQAANPASRPGEGDRPVSRNSSSAARLSRPRPSYEGIRICAVTACQGTPAMVGAAFRPLETRSLYSPADARRRKPSCRKQSGEPLLRAVPDRCRLRRLGGRPGGRDTRGVVAGAPLQSHRRQAAHLRVRDRPGRALVGARHTSGTTSSVCSS